MKCLMLLFLLYPICHIVQAQAVIQENRIVLNSNLNLPLAQFYTVKNNENTKGYLNAFSSIGLGVGINYGKVKVTMLERDTLIEFSNLIGGQIGVLYSSEANSDNSKTSFAAFAGLNILDVQIGGGYEFGNKLPNQTGWFISISYGIPITKLGATGSYMFKARDENISRFPRSSLY